MRNWYNGGFGGSQRRVPYSVEGQPGILENRIYEWCDNVGEDVEIGGSEIEVGCQYSTAAGYDLTNTDLACLESGMTCESTPDCRLCGQFRGLFRDWPKEQPWPNGQR